MLRRNRPGTKAQVSCLHLSCGGTLGAQPSRTCKLAAPKRRLGWGGRRAGALLPGLLFRSRSPSVWLRPRRPVRPAESRLEGELEVGVYGPRGQ